MAITSEQWQSFGGAMSIGSMFQGFISARAQASAESCSAIKRVREIESTGIPVTLACLALRPKRMVRAHPPLKRPWQAWGTAKGQPLLIVSPPSGCEVEVIPVISAIRIGSSTTLLLL